MSHPASGFIARLRNEGISMSEKNPRPSGKKRETPRRATMHDVAKQAGVAQSTVSHVINGTAPIGDAVRKRVMDAIRETSYSPNAMARALRQSRSRLIGVIVPDISSEFYACAASAILKAAQQDQYVALLCDTHIDLTAEEKDVHELLERRADGLIFIGGTNDEEIIRKAHESGVAVVLGDRRMKGLPSVEFNNTESTREVVHRLFKAGYRKFGYVGEPVDIQGNLRERFDGFVRGTQEVGISREQCTVMLDPSLHWIKTRTTHEIFRDYFRTVPRSQMPEVFLTSNDMIAQGIIRAAVTNGLKVPQDIAVVGFDDQHMAEFNVPSISTVAQDSGELGARCFEMLLDELAGRPHSERIMLDQKILARESAPLDGTPMPV